MIVTTDFRTMLHTLLCIAFFIASAVFTFIATRRIGKLEEIFYVAGAFSFILSASFGMLVLFQ